MEMVVVMLVVWMVGRMEEEVTRVAGGLLPGSTEGIYKG